LRGPTLRAHPRRAIVTGGGMDVAAAHAYVNVNVNELIKNHRYVRDVY
jgi:hypothetical protein